MHSAVKRISLLQQVLSRIKPPALELDSPTPLIGSEPDCAAAGSSSIRCSVSPTPQSDDGLSWSSEPNLSNTSNNTG